MANYIMSLRKYVGNSPIIQCGACVFIEKDNKVLLQRRVDNDAWGVPGGALELGESLEEAAVREVREETGLIIDKEDLKLFKTFSGKELHHIYPNGDEVYNVATAFTTKVFKGEFKYQKEETKDLKFFGKDEIPENLNPPDIIMINSFFNISNNLK
ncbi:NUDIX hydrolase [Clostridium fallax]|uniref:ADP-ribose pyrophosphatase YjhB, NUDIX family n=1 Tax=Clostridium fallax TaxID=1533 RepID=A0A1M4Y6X7_9CLOT|nr:NUDIX hydrolase [Clostridium fallax]SHF01376.1 ADP-ribose pyrophosphatase YjhB, NUDIX family [Clostridium fallax]SQB07453.1 ADP-ribose pyrophosphatase [Clostridium fallax]